MDAELARSLLAGWIAGAMAGMAATGLLLLVLARRPQLAARLPTGARRLPLLGMVGANVLTMGLTLVGLVLGALFHRAGGEEAAVRFGLVVGGGLAVVGGLYAFVRGRLRSAEAPAVLVVLAVAGVSFGVVLPLLGSIDP